MITIHMIRIILALWLSLKIICYISITYFIVSLKIICCISITYFIISLYKYSTKKKCPCKIHDSRWILFKNMKSNLGSSNWHSKGFLCDLQGNTDPHGHDIWTVRVKAKCWGGKCPVNCGVRTYFWKNWGVGWDGGGGGLQSFFFLF